MSRSPGKNLAEACSKAMHSKDFAAQELGMEIVESGPGYSRLEMTVRRDMLNGHAVCHGGLIFALADTAFAHACNSYNEVSLATSCTIDYRAPAVEGDVLTAVALERWRLNRTGLYDIDVHNGNGELIAVFRGKSFSTKGQLVSADD